MEGYLVIADLRGYTSFLMASELDHAQDILNMLLNTLTIGLSKGLEISKLEGDAVLGYCLAGSLDYGQTLLDLVESVYVEFRKLRENMKLSTTCRCRACANIPNLDLKFFIHYGEFLLAKIAGREELSGPAVILVHRLLKNVASKQAGLSAYVMFTHQSLQAMGMEDFGAGLIHAQETYEHLGGVGVCLHDLHAVWERDRRKMDCFVRPEQAAMSCDVKLPVAPAVAWDIVTNPATRAIYMNANRMYVTESIDGRIVPGATYHCAHGDGVTEQFILDWQPVDYLTTRDRVMKLLDASITILFTTWLKPEPDGTRVTITLGQPEVDRAWFRPFMGLFWRLAMQKQMEHIFAHQIEPRIMQVALERANHSSNPDLQANSQA